MGFLLPACAGPAIIPLDLEKQIDPKASFAQVKEAPTTHRGTVIVLSGEVLDATRLKDRTRLTILQLPTDGNHAPTMDLSQSRGRFLAFQTEFLDPATVPNGTRITIVGEVSGATTELLDEMEYTYPTVTIKFLKVWPEAMQPPYVPIRALLPSLVWGPPIGTPARMRAYTEDRITDCMVRSNSGIGKNRTNDISHSERSEESLNEQPNAWKRRTFASLKMTT